MAEYSRLPAPPFAALLRRSSFIIPVALALGLAACSGTKQAAPEITSSIAKPVTAEDFAKSADYWGNRYAKTPKDKTVALNYASALRRVDRNEQSVAVLQRATINNANDREVMAAYGKALAADGDLPRALGIIQRAQTPDQPDWKLMSAEAAIQDQLGQHGEAQRLYALALQLAPNEPSVLSNMGMSYVLAGDLTTGEKILRQAASQPGADSRVRQNLALAVGLSGRYGEAERIASAELPPAEAAQNVSYLKSMMSQQNNWKALQQTAAVDTNATN